MFRSSRAPAEEDVSKVPVNQLGMKVLYEGSRVDVDIIAVHGLGAIPDITWRETNSQVNWLQDRDMLPRAIPNSRIMRFGYDSLWFCRDPVRTRAETIANTFLANLEELREDCGNRPIIFIAHCFGGLVVQKALTIDVLQNSRKQNSTILTKTAGIIFLGTPHAGTVSSINERVVNSNNVLSLLLATSDLRQEGEILKNLESSHNTLSEISKEFLLVCIGYNTVIVINFFEQRSSKVGRQFGGNGVQVEFAVGEASATLGHYPSFGLPLDHYSLNKFASQDDGNFKLLLGRIKNIYSHIPTKIGIPKETPNEEHGFARPGSANTGGDGHELTEKVVAIRTRVDKNTRKLWREATVVLTLVPIVETESPELEPKAVVWKVLSYNAGVSKTQTCTWKNEAGFCAIDETGDERIKPKRPRTVVVPGQSVRLMSAGESGTEDNVLSEPEEGDGTDNIIISNETGNESIALYTIDKTRRENDQDRPVFVVTLEEGAEFKCSLPVLLQAYSLSGFQERQTIETDRPDIMAKALFLKNGRPQPIDIRELGKRTTFTLYSDNNNKVLIERG